MFLNIFKNKYSYECDNKVRNMNFQNFYLIFLYIQYNNKYIYIYVYTSSQSLCAYVVTLWGSSMSMSISSLAASVTELVCEVKRLPLQNGNTLFSLTCTRNMLPRQALSSRQKVLFN